MDLGAVHVGYFRFDAETCAGVSMEETFLLWEQLRAIRVARYEEQLMPRGQDKPALHMGQTCLVRRSTDREYIQRPAAESGGRVGKTRTEIKLRPTHS